MAAVYSLRHSAIGSILILVVGSLKLLKLDGQFRWELPTKSAISSWNKFSGRGDEYPRDGLYAIPLTPIAKFTAGSKEDISRGEFNGDSSMFPRRRSCADSVGDSFLDILDIWFDVDDRLFIGACVWFVEDDDDDDDDDDCWFITLEEYELEPIDDTGAWWLVFVVRFEPPCKLDIPLNPIPDGLGRAEIDGEVCLCELELIWPPDVGELCFGNGTPPLFVCIWGGKLKRLDELSEWCPTAAICICCRIPCATAATAAAVASGDIGSAPDPADWDGKPFEQGVPG